MAKKGKIVLVEAKKEEPPQQQIKALPLPMEKERLDPDIGEYEDSAWSLFGESIPEWTIDMLANMMGGGYRLCKSVTELHKKGDTPGGITEDRRNPSQAHGPTVHNPEGYL